MIRPATADDVPGLLELELLGFGADAYPEELVVPALGGTLVLDDDGLAGYAQLAVAGDVADLHRIVVRPGRRRGGLARSLVEAVAAEARVRGAVRLLLEVRADNASALALYAATGFVRIARRPRYYRDGTDALVLARSLELPA